MKKLLIILAMVLCSPSFAASLTWEVKINNLISKEVKTYILDDKDFKRLDEKVESLDVAGRNYPHNFRYYVNGRWSTSVCDPTLSFDLFKCIVEKLAEGCDITKVGVDMNQVFKKHTFAEIDKALLEGKHVEIEGDSHNPYRLMGGLIVDVDCDPENPAIAVGSVLLYGDRRTRIIEPPVTVKYLKPISKILEEFPGHKFIDEGLENVAKDGELYRICYKYFKYFGGPLDDYPHQYYNPSWVEEEYIDNYEGYFTSRRVANTTIHNGFQKKEGVARHEYNNNRWLHTVYSATKNKRAVDNTAS